MLNRLNKYFGIFIIVFLFSHLHATSRFRLSLGSTYATFQDGDGEGKIGLFAGVGKEWGIYKNLSFVSGVNYVQKGAILKHKIVKYYLWDASVFVYDIDCSIGFLDIPIGIQYKLPIYKKFGLEIFWGPSLLLAVQDRSSTRLIDEYLSQETKNDFTFTDLWGWFYHSSGWGINSGFGLTWDSFSVECRYTRDQHIIDFIQGIDIMKKYKTVSIVCTYSI